MRISGISFVTFCSTLIFAHLRGCWAQNISSSALPQTSSPSYNTSQGESAPTPAVIFSSPYATLIPQNDPAKENQTAAAPTVSAEINSSPTAKIIMEGFVTNVDSANNNGSSAEMKTTGIVPTEVTPNSTNFKNTTLNTTTAKLYPLRIDEDDLTLSFISSSSHINTAAAFIPSAKSASIIAGVFICFAIVAYGSLIVWRRVLERRYGNRELLVNEEFYDVNGLKYFEL